MNAPRLLVLTDPVRTPDPYVLASRLPAGSALVYRHFGVADRYETAGGLAQLCHERGAYLLVSSDLELADRIGADGVHWPERFYAQAAQARARSYTSWFTAAAHSAPALQKAAALGMDAALLSPIFASNSPSAGSAIGALRARLLIRQSALPVYLLGGIRDETMRRITNSGAAGFAMVEAFNETV